MGLLFKAFKISLISLYIALSVAVPDLKTDCYSTRILCLFKCFSKCLYITFSVILEKELKIDIGL